MEIKIIRDILDFKNLQEDWNIIFRNNNYSIFQSFEFNYFSWKFALSKSNNILSIVVLSEGNDIKSILPFYIDRRLKLRFINDTHADFCDYLTDIEVDFNLVVKELRSNFSIRYFNEPSKHKHFIPPPEKINVSISIYLKILKKILLFN